MSETLQRIARDQFWCNPTLDKKSIFQGNRVSDKDGVRGTVELPWQIIELPNTTDTFHVIRLGQVPSHYLGIDSLTSVWADIKDIMVSSDTLIDIFNENLRGIPSTLAYVIKTEKRGVYVAIREVPAIKHLLDVDKIFISFYQTSFKGSDENTYGNDIINVGGGEITTEVERLAWINEFYVWRDAFPMGTSVTVNGVERVDLRPSDIKVGDVLEYRQDKSIYKSLTFSLDNLPTYVNDAGNSKLLVHQPKSENPTLRIDYKDDIDFILYVTDGTIYKGINLKDVLSNNLVKMLTHSDYGIDLATCQHYINLNRDIFTKDFKTMLMVRVRKDGYHKTMPNDGTYINHMYRMSDNEIISAIVGSENYVAAWKGSELEKSPLNAIMSHVLFEEFSKDNIDGLFGKPLVQTHLAQVEHVKPSNGDINLKFPDVMTYACTAYTYDGNGKLIASLPHAKIGTYSHFTGAVEMVHLLPGVIGTTTTFQWKMPRSPIDPKVNYTHLVQTAVSDSEVAPKWRQAIKDTDYVEVDTAEGKFIYWTGIDHRLVNTLTLDDYSAVGTRKLLEPIDGILQFDIKANLITTDGFEEMTLPIAPSKTYVWLNGYPLIEGIDFYITDKNRVIVTNKSRYSSSEKQIIDYRSEFIFNDEGESTARREVGHIRHGMLSRNNEFDIRSNDVVICNIDNQMVRLDSLAFDEDHSGVSVGGNSVSIEGAPYELTFVNPTLWDYDIKADDTIEKEIGTWFTSKFPMDEIKQPITVDSVHELYSPFISALISDMVTGVIHVPHHDITDLDMAGLVQHRMELLNYDPATKGLIANLVKIHPHPFTIAPKVALREYSLLLRIIDRYLNGSVSLNQFVTVGD